MNYRIPLVFSRFLDDKFTYFHGPFHEEHKVEFPKEYVDKLKQLSPEIRKLIKFDILYEYYVKPEDVHNPNRRRRSLILKTIEVKTYFTRSDIELDIDWLIEEVKKDRKDWNLPNIAQETLFLTNYYPNRVYI
jgi:hypothetical protein